MLPTPSQVQLLQVVVEAVRHSLKKKKRTQFAMSVLK